GPPRRRGRTRSAPERHRFGRPSAWSSAGGPAPLAVEHRVDELALPLALHELVLDQVRLAPHPELLEDAGGGAVPGLKATDHAVELEVFERDPQQGARGLGRVSPALVRRVDDEADLALPVLQAHEPEDQVGDEL